MSSGKTDIIPIVTAYESNLDLAGAAELIRQAAARGPVVVLTHAKPDGDAFGSVVALTAALQAMGAAASAYLVGPIASAFFNLPGGDLPVIFDESRGYAGPGSPALIVLLDTGAWAQVGPLRPTIEAHLDRTLIVDHHLSGDIPAAHRLVDTTAAAAAQIVAELIDALGVRGQGSEVRGQGSGKEEKQESKEAGKQQIQSLIPNPQSPTIASALYTGIASDTGWFRFSNTTARTHELAAKLLRQGVDHAWLYRLLEQNERPQKLGLLAKALDSLEIIGHGQAAVMTLRRGDFAQTGALEQETERLIDVPQQIGSVRVVALITERPATASAGGDAANHTNEPARVTSLSFRSKPGEGAVNVAQLASEFGGGGHARAAGAKVNAPVSEVLPRVRKALREALQPSAPEVSK